MSRDFMLINAFSALVFLVGVAKLVSPEAFLALRRKFPWWDKLDFWAFLYRSNRAVTVVRIIGGVLILMAVFAWGAQALQN